MAGPGGHRGPRSGDTHRGVHAGRDDVPESGGHIGDVVPAATLAAGSTMVFSYSRPIEMAPAEIRPILQGAADGAAASGHPWLSLLSPDDAAALAYEAGFGDVAIVTSQDLHDRYFAERGDQLSPVGGEDLVIATVSTA